MSAFSPAFPVQTDGERARLIWLTRLRWVAIGGQLAVVLPALELGWLDQGLLLSFLAVVGGLVILNLITARFIVPDRNPGRDMLLIQLLLDLSALTSLLLLSGGAWNPLAPLLLVHAALGGLLLQGLRSAAMLTALVLAIAGVSLFPLMPPALPQIPTPVLVMLPSMTLVALVVWGFTTWLTQTLDEHRRLLLNLKALQERGDRLRAAGALAAGFSHEFSSPLNTVKLRLQRLGRSVGDENPDLVAALAAADRCESVLRRMVGRQLEPGELRMEPVDPETLVRRVCDSWASMGRPWELVVRALPRATVVLPPLALTQSLLNLLDNAGEAMSMVGDRSSPVRVEVDTDGVNLRIAVTDRGPGWPEVVRENLGQPFLTTKSEGTGLGLYNAHALATALGGRLLLEDAPGGGATAAIVMPIEAFAPGDLP